MNRRSPGFSLSKAITGFLQHKAAEALSPTTLDITAQDDECPDTISHSDWEGDIAVDGDDLVVTLYVGSQAES